MRRNTSKKYYFVIVSLSLIFAILACNTPTGANTVTPLAGQTASVLPGTPATATIAAPTTEATTAAPQATAQLTPSLTPTTECNYDSVYVADITIPDGTEVVAGAGFTKTWRIKNNGCLPWPSGTVLLFVEGEQMGGPVSVTVPGTAVNGTQDISVNMTAPVSEGEHTGYWRLRSADGIPFGDKIYLKIKTIPPTPTVTVTPPFLIVTMHVVPNLFSPDLYVNEFTLTPATPVADSPTHARIGIYNKGTAAANTPFVVRWFGGADFTSKSCEWTINSMPKGSGAIIECDFTFASWYPTLNTKVVVDATSAITESDETNNIFLKAITVAKH